MTHPTQLDDIDRQLLEALQRDCKQPLSKMGERVGLSAPAVMERVRKLEGAGVITGYHASVDGRRLGLDITSFIGVSINYPKDIDEFLRELSERPEVLECHHVTGGHTLLLKVKTRNTASLERLISRLRQVEGVTRTETMVVLSTASESTRIPLGELEPAAEAPRRKARRAS
ncbi:MAG TPA: Lrp/AsnC family transcriptional regulator [Sandaracinaceae bacterium LLY-WYZ-13_1]|nr:Lrp/AsnC family transcriptional regulator [Sandaracinaceae bacterium LLY-WYZ-13_1]